MPLFHELREVTLGALLSLIIGLVPLVMAGVYAYRPSEQRLSLMRPFSLAAIFAAVCGMVGGMASILQGIGATGTFTTRTYGAIAMGCSQALIPIYVGFSCLTVAWLLVALGMRRAGR